MAELNSEGRYDDLLYTKFPAEIDSWEDVVDVTADTVALANQYRELCASGDYAAAHELLENDETGMLKKMQINAMTINQQAHAIMAMERLFKTDVETYVKGQVFEDDLMIWTYTHSYNEETHVHNFKGKGYNGKAKCTATFNSGDTIAVNGVKVPGYAGSDKIENAGSDIIINGRWCSFIYDGTQVNFKGGGGVSSSVLAQTTADASCVLKGKTFFAGSKEQKNGKLPNLSIPKNKGGDAATSLNAQYPNVGVDVTEVFWFTENGDGVKRICLRPNYGAFGGSSGALGTDGYVGMDASKLGTAYTSQVLEGATFTSGNCMSAAQAGTMPNRAGLGFQYSGSNKAIPEGYYDGSGVVSVAGGSKGSKSYTYSGSSITIVQGWYNGAGSVNCLGGNQGAFSRTIAPGGSVTIPQGYHNGNGVITAQNVGAVLKTTTIGHDCTAGQNRFTFTGGTLVGVTYAGTPYNSENILQGVGADGNVYWSQLTANAWMKFTLVYY